MFKKPVMANILAATTKVPPYSVHSEKVLLGSMLREPRIVKDVKKIISDGDGFFRPEHGRLYDAMIKASRKRRSLDTESLIAAAAASGTLDDAEAANQLRELVDVAEDPAKALEHAKVIAEKARMRRLIDAISDTLNDAYHSPDGFDAILGRAQKRLDELGENAR